MLTTFVWRKVAMLKRTVCFGILLGVAAVYLTGCATTNLVDRAFVGELSDRPPIKENRYALGLFLYPIAVTIDAATLPLQYIALMIGGDDLLYKWDKKHTSSEIDFTPTPIPETATRDEVRQIISNDINRLSLTDPYKRAKIINRIYTQAYYMPGTSTLRKFNATAHGSGGSGAEKQP